MVKTIIFDLDGTLTDLTHRLHHIMGEKKDWPKFMDAVDGDAPIEEIVWLCKAVNFAAASDGIEIVFCSGRNKSTESKTREWIEKYLGIKRAALFMRADGDYRPDYEIKKELLGEMLAIGYEPFLVFDDRQQVVDMWRKEGIRCIQVAPGNF